MYELIQQVNDGIINKFLENSWKPFPSAHINKL